MDNYQIAGSLSLLAKLSDIHGENSFKAKSYATAAFSIEKLSVQLSSLPEDKIFSIKGIGESTAKKIIELLQTGNLNALLEIIEKTPPGIIELLNIKGLGPKKIAVIWKEMEIESVGELLYACKENRLKLFKGFGEKTQYNVTETIEFYLKSQGSFLYSQVNLVANEVKNFFEKIFFSTKISFTGGYKRQLEIIHELQLVVDDTKDNVVTKLSSVPDFTLIENNSEGLLYKADIGLNIRVYCCNGTLYTKQLFFRNCSDEFAAAFTEQFPLTDFDNCEDDAAIFKSAGIQFIPVCQRETIAVIDKAKAGQVPTLLRTADIKGIIHSHSNWSDGSNTIEEMAKGAMAQGFEYLVISDHSKSAFYANGLDENRIREQHLYIDELNRQIAPFKIFKSIESDILNDGNLDYSDAILSTFDLVIASIHSNLKMNEDKAMMRLIKAIENPYTVILGHMTGRLLLSRKGYPVDHKKIIDACAANKVVIELNAHPSRLDIDWRHVAYALEKNVLISIDPDAHTVNGFSDIKYGVLAAQKALVSKENNFSSFGIKEMEAYLSIKRQMR